MEKLLCLRNKSIHLDFLSISSIIFAMEFTNKSSRPFNISCGLLPGYDTSNETQDMDKAQQCIGNWMVQRLHEGKRIAVGTLLPGEFIYPANDSAAGYQVEGAFHYRGMIRDDASEEEAEEMLKDLAKVLSKELQQKRVHISYCNTYWILE